MILLLSVILQMGNQNTKSKVKSMDIKTLFLEHFVLWYACILYVHSTGIIDFVCSCDCSACL